MLEDGRPMNYLLVVFFIIDLRDLRVTIALNGETSLILILKVAKTLPCPMFCGYSVLTMEPQCLSAMTTVMVLFTYLDTKLSPVTETLAEMLLIGH